MEEVKREVLDVKGGNIAKLNVSKGEDLAELYAQDNRLEELDLSANKKLEVLECGGNPLKFIRAVAPGSDGRDFINLEAGKGGYISLKLAPGVQQYAAEAEEGFEFDGWYDELGDRLGKDPVWNDTHGAGRTLVAWFRNLSK